MDTQIIRETASRTLAGTISFPEVVDQLICAGVEYYHVDYVARRKAFYAADGSAVVVTPISYGGLPAVPPDFDPVAVQAAIVDSQRHGQLYRDFTRRVMAAGVQGYFAFLRGKRVTYVGRQGDQHTEWFPGAAPEARQQIGILVDHGYARFAASRPASSPVAGSRGERVAPGGTRRQSGGA